MYFINILLLGLPGVGKSSFLKRLNFEEFTEQYTATTETYISKFEISTNVEKKIAFTIYEIPYNDYISEILKIRNITNIDGIIFMFDLTQQQSFDNTCKLIKDVKNNINENDYDNIHKVIMGNKYDIKKRKVSNNYITGINNNEIYGRCQYYPYSVKSFLNFDLPLLNISRKTLKLSQPLFFEDDVIEILDENELNI
jgi:small GTP-binding protein